jgi:integrase
MATNTVADVFLRYKNDEMPKKADATQTTDNFIINRILRSSPLASVLLLDLGPDDIAAFRDDRLKTIKPGSVNRELALISHAFTVAKKEWQWIQFNPVLEITRPKTGAYRTRRTADEEIAAILAELEYPGIAGEIAAKKPLTGLFWLIALETGLRRGEIFRMAHRDDHGAYVTVMKGKTTSSVRHVPLTKKARALFDQRWLALASAEHPRPDSISKDFIAARKRCGIKGLTFHDSRHEAITGLAHKLDILDLVRMTGHKNPKELLPYYNPTPEEMAERLNGVGKKKRGD